MSALASANPKSVKELLLDAALRQGPAFVLLVALLVAGARTGDYVVTHGIPAHLARIQEGYQAIQSSHDRNLDRLITAFERDRDRFRVVIDALAKLVDNEEVDRANHELLRRVVAQLEVLSRDRTPTASSRP